MNEHLLARQRTQREMIATERPVGPAGGPETSSSDTVLYRLAAIEEQLTVCHLIAGRIETGIAGAQPVAGGSAEGKISPEVIGLNGLTLNLRDSVAMLRQRLEVIAVSLG